MYKERFLSLLFYFLPLLVFAKGQEFSLKPKANLLIQMEDALAFEVDCRDTFRINTELTPLLKLSRSSGHKQWEVIYFIRLAEAYSVYFGHANERSNCFFDQAEKLAEQIHSNEMHYIVQIRKGYYHYGYRQMKVAFSCILKAADIENELNYEKVPLLAKHLLLAANFYAHIGHYGQASQLISKGLPWTPKGGRQHMDMLNAIGLYSMSDSIFDKAMLYFQEAKKVALAAKDSVWLGIISGNIAQIKLVEGDTLQAISLLENNIKLSMYYGESVDAMRALLKVAGLMFSMGKHNQALEYAMQSETYMEDKPYFVSFKTDLAKLKADICASRGDYIGELKYRNLYTNYLHQLLDQNRNDELQKAYWNWESERYQTAEERRRFVLMMEVGGILLFIAVFFIILLLSNKAKNKLKMKSTLLEKDQLRLALEKQKLDQELKATRSSLQDFVDTIKMNDTTIMQLKMDLKTIKAEKSVIEEHVSDSLEEILRSPMMTDDRWVRFKLVFDKVFPNYLQHYKTQCSQLSDNDLRFLALIKLELSNIGMARLLGISVDGVKKGKQRLRKKLQEYGVAEFT